MIWLRVVCGYHQDYAVGFHWITANVEHHAKLFLFTHFLYEGLEVIAFYQLIATPTIFTWWLAFVLCVDAIKDYAVAFQWKITNVALAKILSVHTLLKLLTICRGLGHDRFLSVNCNSIVGWSGCVDPLERADRSAREKGGNSYWKLFDPHTCVGEWVKQNPQNSRWWSPRTFCFISINTHAVQV